MTNDTERREVARGLREMGEELGSSVLLWYYIAKILGVRTATDGKTACGMLADLIEPSCDRDALLKVADMLECDGECSECECGKGTFCEAPTIAAARIREALGVEL